MPQDGRYNKDNNKNSPISGNPAQVSSLSSEASRITGKLPLIRTDKFVFLGIDF